MCWLEQSDYSMMEMQQTCRTPLSAWLEPAAYEPGAVQQWDALELIWRQMQLVISSTLLCGILLLGDNSYVNWNVFELCKFSLVHLFHLLSYTELLEGRDHILFIFGFSELIIMPFGTLMFTEWRNSCLTINHLRTQIMFLFKEVFCISPQCTGQYPIQGSTQWVVY